jgi:hypothetical protein
MPRPAPPPESVVIMPTLTGSACAAPAAINAASAASLIVLAIITPSLLALPMNRHAGMFEAQRINSGSFMILLS